MKLLLPLAVGLHDRIDEELDVLVRFLISVDAVHLAKQSLDIIVLFVAVVITDVICTVIPLIKLRLSIRGYPDAQFIILVGQK